MTELYSLFPQIDRDIIDVVLNQCNGNVDECYMQLSENLYPQQFYPESKHKSFQFNEGQTKKDEEYARQLQEEAKKRQRQFTPAKEKIINDISHNFSHQPKTKNKQREGFKVSASLILIGETGNGKSSLANFILGKQIFSVSGGPDSTTQFTRGEFGDDENSDIFVIDTPGLQDTRGREREHLAQMVDYIKINPGLQGIVIVLNYHQPKLSLYIQTMIKLLCNLFPSPNLWSHVAFVFSKYYYYLPENEKNRRQVVINQFMPEVLKLVRECNGNQNIQNFPTFFVDTDFERKDQFTCQEIERMILWVHQLSPIDVDMVKVDVDPVIKEIQEEEDIRETKNVVGNIEHITLEYFKRNKEVHYDGIVSYSKWIKYKEEKFDNVLPEVVLKSDIDRKEEHNDTIEGEFRVIRHIKYERTINTFNSGRVQYGEWRVVHKDEQRHRIPRPSPPGRRYSSNFFEGMFQRAADACVIM